MRFRANASTRNPGSPRRRPSAPRSAAPASRRELTLRSCGACRARSVFARVRPSAHRYRPATFSRILPPPRRCCTASWMCSRGYTPATGTTRVPSATSGAASRMTGTTLSR